MGVGKSYGNDEMSYADIELWSDESGDVELFEGNFATFFHFCFIFAILTA